MRDPASGRGRLAGAPGGHEFRGNHEYRTALPAAQMSGFERNRQYMRDLGRDNLAWQREVQGQWAPQDEPSRQDLVDDLQAVQAGHGPARITSARYRDHGRYRPEDWRRHFGSFEEFRRHAGVTRAWDASRDSGWIPVESDVMFARALNRTFFDAARGYPEDRPEGIDHYPVQPTIEQIREERRKHTSASFTLWATERSYNFDRDTKVLITRVIAEFDAPALIGGQTGLEPDIAFPKTPYVPHVEPAPEKSTRVDFIDGEIVFRSAS